MGVLGSISLKFHPSPQPSHTLSLLLAASWQFFNGVIWYQHFDAVEGSGDDLEAPVSEWERVSAVLDAKYQSGETVVVACGYEGTEWEVRFSFRQEPDEIQEMSASLQEPRPRLCGRFTDFGCYLPKIVCPLYEGQHNILEVTCYDDAY